MKIDIIVTGDNDGIMSNYLSVLMKLHGFPVEGDVENMTSPASCDLPALMAKVKRVRIRDKNRDNFKWTDYLINEDGETYVKGTFVTVNHIISLIVDGWTHSDILKTHPELTEKDIQACLCYEREMDGYDCKPVEIKSKERQGNGYSRITGRPYPEYLNAT